MPIALSRLWPSLMGLVILWLALSGTAGAQYVMTAPPRETADAGREVYGPVADALSQVLGQAVVYRHPGDWPSYARNMRADQYDIVFDGPHFAAWRLQNLSARPLVKLPGELRFVLIAAANDEVNHPEGLLGKRICTLPLPNLATLTAYSLYPNPVQQPEFVQIRGGMREVTDALSAGRCRGAMLRKAFFTNQLSGAEQSAFKVLAESDGLTNQGITVSRRVTEQDRETMLAFLTGSDGPKAAQALLNRFSRKNPSFVSAGTADYEGHNLLRDNMVFGW